MAAMSQASIGLRLAGGGRSTWRARDMVMGPRVVVVSRSLTIGFGASGETQSASYRGANPSHLSCPRRARRRPRSSWGDENDTRLQYPSHGSARVANRAIQAPPALRLAAAAVVRR